MRRGACIAGLLLAGCIGSLGGMPGSPYFVSYRATDSDIVRREAAAGDAEAQAALGYDYERGENGLPKREDEAARLYRLAAAQGSPAGQTNFAVLLATGRGMARNDVEAVRLLAAASGKGFRPAEVYLSAFYLARRGGIPDGDPTALAALRAVIERDVRSMFCLESRIVFAAASQYEAGTALLPRDPSEAIRLYKKLADFYPSGCGLESARKKLAEIRVISATDGQ
jgi:TPR repeat protein